MCRWVWSRNLKKEEALAHWGLLLQKKKKKLDRNIWSYLGVKNFSQFFCTFYLNVCSTNTYLPVELS